MKLTIMEDFESTTSIGTQLNPITDIFTQGDFSEYGKDVDIDSAMEPIQNFDSYVHDCVAIYEDLEALGFVFMLASNDIHTIHINACGKDFTRLHLETDELYKQLNEFSDTCLEMCCEDGHFIYNLNNAKDNLTQWSIEVPDKEGFDLVAGIETTVCILNNVVIAIKELYPDVSSDIQSTMDEWLRYLTSKMNYFLGRIIQKCDKPCVTNESIMLRNTRHDKPIVYEKLDKLKLGQSYKMFCQVEDHIEDYNCDTVSLKKGDYIIRDFQFGHLPNGGNKGYIPYEVVDIEYDRDDNISGYRDVRKRLHLYDGYEDFYIECYNDRFNGMFHKLKKSSIQK